MAENNTLPLNPEPTPINMQKLTSNGQIYVAFDIETGGSRLDAAVIAVGVCYGTTERYLKRR
jgi:hypothetical protein